MGEPFFVFHGHFYQPPRENPWTSLVAREHGAAPFHDWNARIDDECYRPNAFGRIVDDEQRIAEVVNNYASMSFNVGPTLMAWLSQHDPLTLRRMIEADRQNARRHGGHGNAIAQAYNHVILPLADPRDRVTQIRWGLSVFRFHFGRDAEALWLPETAASHAVLDDLIDHGMRFVILAPGQAGRIRPIDGGRWKSVPAEAIDPAQPYLYRHRDGSGRGMVVFFYDGPLAHRISFGDALESSARFVERAREAVARAGQGLLIHAAADGETAGHHNAWGDRVLAHALTHTLAGSGMRVTHYAALVDELTPRFEVELDPGPDGEGTAWSCAHGVGRWTRDCGCSIAHLPGWNQGWRAGLRKALDLLRDQARPWFEVEAGRVFHDPWAARDAWVQVILEPTAERRERFMQEHGRPGWSAVDARRGFALLEMQHQLLLQYTSCGWFFDDIAGIESRQVIRYAARALEIWEELGGRPPTEAFLEILAGARSNDPAAGDGARIFRSIRSRDAVSPKQMLAFALLRAHHESVDSGRFGQWSWSAQGRVCLESEAVRLELGHVRTERAPGGEVHEAFVVVRWAGDFELVVHFGPAGPVRDGLVDDLRVALSEGRDGAALESEFGTAMFDTSSLVNDGGRDLMEPILSAPFERLREEVSVLVERHGSLLGTGLGDEEARLLSDFARLARQDAARAALQSLLDGEGRLEDLVRQISGSRIAVELLRPVVERAVEAAVAGGRPDAARRAIAVARALRIPLYLYRAQEAWLEFAQRSADGEGVRELGPELGFAPELCEAVARHQLVDAPGTEGQRR